MSYNAPSVVTTGLGVNAKVTVGLDSESPTPNFVQLSLGANPYPLTYQLETEITDASGNVQANMSFTLTAAAAASGGTTVYTGTITNGGSNAFAGLVFVIAGFANSANNGYFVAVGSSTTTLTLVNAGGAAETHAGTAKSGAYYTPVYLSREPSVATVNSSGVITAVAVGRAVIEVSYPFANNALGTAPDGSYSEKIYKEVKVTVML